METNIKEFQKKINFGIKVWLEFENQSILGSGWAKLLENLDNNEEGSLTQAAKDCGYSYKYSWNILKKIEKRTGWSAVITSKGGSGGGGSVKLNEWGKYLLETYHKLLKELENIEKKLQKTLKID